MVEVWAVDALLNVFQDTVPLKPMGEREVFHLDAARNSTESFQVVVRGSRQGNEIQGHLTEVTVKAEPAVKGDGCACLPKPRVRMVAFIPVRANTPDTPEDELVRLAPGLFPDPIIEESRCDIRRDCSQPFLIDVDVPWDAEPGTYTGYVKVTGSGVNERVPYEIEVFAARVPRERNLKVTNWCSFDAIANWHGLEAFSDGYFDLLRVYARNMAAHRQNTILTPIFSLIRFNAEGSSLGFDFTLFDKFVDLFIEEGVIGYIEGGHLGGREDGSWVCPNFAINTYYVDNGAVQSKVVRATSPEAEAFLEQFLPALEAHLQEKGWLGIYLQHLCDEPIKENIDSYNHLLELVRKYGPKLRTVEANHFKGVDGLSVWVPQMNFWHSDFNFYEEQLSKGYEVWFYTCLAPTGTYCNRFIDYPLIKTRLLHWYNYRYDASGYLHWGYNYWRLPHPFLDVEPVHGEGRCLPPGDAFIIYPGPAGPLDSVRFEAMRAGIEDFELLRQLSLRDKGAADRLASRMVLAHDRAEVSFEAFRSVRKELLKGLSQ